MPKSPTSRAGAVFSALPVLVLTATLSVACAGRPKSEAAAGPTPQAATSPASPIPWGTIEPPKQVGVPAGTPVRTFRGTGVVRSVNLKDGWFEIDHEDIEGYMPAMQMQWRVKDRSMLNSVGAGDKVDFTLVDDNGTELITELKKAQAARQP